MQKIKKGKVTRFRVQFTKPDGSRASAMFSLAKDAADFETRLSRTAERMYVGMPAAVEKIVMMAAVVEWLKNRKHNADQGLSAYSAWVTEESKMRRVWVPALGHYPLTSIAKGDVLQVLNKVFSGELPTAQYKKTGKTSNHQGGVSAATRNRHLAMIHKFFEDQIDLGRMEFNPAARIPMLAEKVKTRELVALSDAHADAYQAVADELEPEYGILTALCLERARIGEAIALRVMDIDFARDSIRVHRTLEIVSGEIKERTKGQRGGGEYTLPMFPSLKERLKAWVKGKRLTDYVVSHQGDPTQPYSYWRAQRLNAEAVKLARKGNASFPRITLHDLRRTGATKASDEGFTDREVSYMLGHKSTRTTEASYLKRRNPRQLIERGAQLGYGRVIPIGEAANG